MGPVKGELKSESKIVTISRYLLNKDPENETLLNFLRLSSLNIQSFLNNLKDKSLELVNTFLLIQ